MKRRHLQILSEERNYIMEHVTFKNFETVMSGNLFLPDDFDASKKYKALTVVHPGGGVKEQVSGLYAEEMSKQGYIALAFDASHQGESGGEPRYLENPYERVNDVRASVDYLASLPYVDENRIGCIGICAGGGYSVNAACSEHRIRAIATVSAMDVGDSYRQSYPYDAVDKALLEAGKQRSELYAGKDARYIHYIPDTLEEAEATHSAMILGAYDYYKTPRAQHPNSKNILLEISLDYLLSFNAFEPVPYLLTQPLLMIAGTEAETRHYSENAVGLAKGKKELFLLEGADHMDLYDNRKYIPLAVAKLVSFFRENL
ncbi:MAG: alpha/beta hydrolase [Lachnospiraceae bacterium]|nr:alpha/beta hydrolase [Lachnospiraceae bacterium]